MTDKPDAASRASKHAGRCKPCELVREGRAVKLAVGCRGDDEAMRMMRGDALVRQGLADELPAGFLKREITAVNRDRPKVS